ncbi:protein timeless homolog isoform X1 [Rhipicephalus sanguineus]|uniref:protein timeless homolog isoform X1 n=1 Tax=Rhipicephalus sanguineus TaxID=34632 RepID=UPI0020C583BC|nr:protein timeless homolog isoform X1 [Rhipicephalus sanguineus]
MSESISSLVLSDIQAACSTLGGWDEGKYYKEPDCIESLKDLLRYLRRDDESHEIRRILGRIQVLKTDLLPLLKFYPDDESLFDVIIRLLVDLTNPAILLYKEELPVEKFARNNYLEIVSHLQSYKLAFTDSKVWISITKKLEALLHKNWETRQEEDKDMIERILVLVRNVLHVPANPSEEKRTDDDVNVHDQVLWAMHLAHLEDLLLYVTSSDDETDYCFHCLEILSLMLREQSPEVLARAEQPRTAAEKDEDVRELLKAREMELARKKMQIQARTKRHPRFGGTFTVKNMKGIGDNNLVAHDTLSKLSHLSFDRSKPFKAKPKNRRPVLAADDVMRRSTLNIRLFLKGLCTDFLKWCYNPMMRTVKSFLQRKKGLAHDEGYYFWALKFFMEFNRHNGFDVSLVSETICKEAFHYVQTELEQYYEMMVTDKRKIHIWSKRLHVGLKAYQELLQTLAAMDSSPEQTVQEAAKVLKGTIFYLPEYREIVLHLLLNFNECVQPISYLRDLVEMVHVYVKMLQHFAKGHRHIIVKEKTKAKKKAKKQMPKETSASAAVSEEVRQQEWLEVSSGISLALQGEEELPDDVVPYDSTLDNTENEQKLDALSRIHAALKARETAKAVALLRAGQELWPGQDMFGSQEEGTEFQALKEIFFANMAGTAPDASTAGENQTAEANEEEEEEEQYNSDREQEFHFDDFIKRFASPKVVIAYCKLLSHYRTNSPATNQQVLRMLHRLAWDLKMYPMLFQASVFKTFQNIMHDCYSLPKERVDGTLKELARLATFVVRKFVATAKENKIVFAELLFWKNTKDAYELVHGYGSGSKKPSKVAWTEEQVYELKVLYERYKEEMTPDKDVVDLILEHMIDDSRTRRSVLLQLKHLGLIDNVKAFTKKAKANAPWRGEDVIELRELFEKYRESTDIMGQIMEHLSVKRPRHRVVDKLLEIGLVCNRVELRKKRARTGGRGGRQQRGSDDSGSSSDDNDERIYDLFKSGEDPVRPSQQKNGGRTPKNAASRPPKDAPTFRTVPRTEVATSPEALRSVLSKLVETGCQESLEWLLSSLEDALEDWDSEDPSSVPLVPILETHHSSMENSDFCSLLRTMGIQPPADEQEAYWRIPADMTTTMLNSRVTVIKKALEGDYGAPLLVVGSASNEAAPELISTDSDSDGPSLVIDEDREASATSARIPKNKLKHREALQALLQKKRARQDDSSDTDSDEVGFARRDQRKRKRPRARDTREIEGGIGSTTGTNERRSDGGISGDELPASSPAGTASSNADGGRTPPLPPTTAEPIKKRKRATLVVDSDEERESSKRAQLVDVDSEEDVGPLVIADDETASGAGRAGKGGRLVVLDDSDDEEVVVNSSGAVADRGVANGDAGFNGSSVDVIDLDDGSETSDRTRRSSESLTRSDSLGGSRESRKESSAVVEDGGSGSDAEIIEDAPIRPPVSKPAKARRAVVISSDEED